MKEIYSLFLNTSKEIEELKSPVLARVYYKNHYECLLTEKKEKLSIENFFTRLKVLEWDKSELKVFHLFYELDFLDLSSMSETDILAIEIEYESKTIVNDFPEQHLIKLEKKLIPTFEDYQTKFDQIQYHLKEGNCYQVNLTDQFKYKVSSNEDEYRKLFISKKSKLSEYAHLTYIASKNIMLLSNSPESLFELVVNDNEIEISSRPIKGTLKYDQEHDVFEEKWNTLKNSKKDEAELYMISDLVRSDLASIEAPTAKIIEKKLPLVVPGLIHQYSQLKVNCSKNINLYKVLLSLFPGGSITGAPKKRVRQVIKEVEVCSRGFYCGTTVYKRNKNMGASINIRSAIIDFNKNELSYGSGGGITHQSNVLEEFEEMNNKTKSFLSIFS